MSNGIKHFLMADKSPLHARRRFTLRPLNNWGFSVVVVFFLFWAFKSFLPIGYAVAADAITLVVMGFILFFLLEKRTIEIICPACTAVLRTNTPWLCPVQKCQHHNTNTHKFPFVNRCEKCGTEPKTYICHHCSKPIYLTEDKDKYLIVASLNFPPPVDGRAVKIKTDQENKQDKEQEIAMAELDEKLNIINARVKGPKIKTPAEQKIEMFDREYDGFTGVREHAKKRLKEAEEKHKDDPESLRDAKDAIADLLKRFS